MSRQEQDPAAHLRELRTQLREAQERVDYLVWFNENNRNALAGRVPDAIHDRDKAQQRVDAFIQQQHA